ncbi:MAG: hypothetical protein ABJK64_17340 [Paraglaciecola sp.]|uniref:hypothetical protein n=1 Tax=Paraglaciecola sp. TaxID=1920173 RepID=UPI0032973B6E
MNKNKVSSRPWSVLLWVYLIILFASGYIAFFYFEQNPASMFDVTTVQLMEKNVETFFFEALEVESKAHEKKRDLAFQTFNVVLGAILGFLSASSSTLFERSKSSAEAKDNLT